MEKDYINLGALTSPNEYIEYYYSQLKEHYEARNLQISKNGFIGFMLNVMGFSQYDIKYYYDTLFREAFLATSDNNENLKLHSSIYGYSTKAITPAQLVGEMTFFLESLPVSSNQFKTIIIKDLKVVIGGITYMMESEYRITGTICEITKLNGQVIHIPYDSAVGTLPLVDFNQYEVETFEFTLPYYVYGTHYQKIIELGIQDAQVYDIVASVKLKDSDEYQDFEMMTIKYYSGTEDTVIFHRELLNNQMMFEFGSGVNGLYVPESTAIMKIKYTHGANGNISSNTTTPLDGGLFVFDEQSDQIYSGAVSSLITIDIDHATGGVNNLEKEDLREAIIDYVQTRDNLISEVDFYNILDKHLSDFILLFKKINIVDNSIYAFVPFKDQYLKPLKSKSISIQNILFNPQNKPIVYKPEFSIGGFDYISPFVYLYDSFTRNFAGGIYSEQHSTYFSEIDNILDSETTLPLSLVFNYDPSQRRTRIVVQSYQKISDYVMYIDIPILGVYQCMDVYDDNNQEYYYGNDLYDGLIPHVIDVNIHIFKDVPKLFVYTAKDISLYHDLSDILMLGLYEFLPEYLTTGGTGSGGTGTIGSDPLDEYVGWVFTGGGAPASQVGGEGWFLPQTGFEGMTGDTGGAVGWKPDLPYIYMADYILNIPVMVLQDYLEDTIYYDQKFINTLGQIAINENRMISDDLQIRFLNSLVIESNILKKITVQEHDFKLQLPLKLHVDIGVSQQILIENEINTLDFKDELINNLATQLSDKYTGVSVSFYRTQIVDIVHDIKWVKYCNVFVYDSSEIPNEIDQANFELIDQSHLETGMTKYEAATFCPAYIWWDLDNIEIELIFE